MQEEGAGGGGGGGVGGVRVASSPQHDASAGRKRLYEGGLTLIHERHV